jgi:oligogalacturonide transporter
MTENTLKTEDNQQNMSIPTSDKIPLKEQILYGASDMFGGGQAAFLSVILLAFFTNMVGISAAVAGTIITVSKLWDAVSDPTMGIISENTRRFKLGRRKPYMIIGGILIPFGLAFLFAPIQSWGLGAGSKGVWMAFAYLIYCTISTISQVPFMSMSSDISLDYKERNKANTWKLGFDILPERYSISLPRSFGATSKRGEMTYNQFYLIIVFGFGLLFGLPLIVGGLTIKERVPYDKNIKTALNMKEYFKGLSIKSYILHITMYICAFLSFDIVSALAIYYTDYIGGAAEGLVIDFGITTVNMGSIMIIGQ